MAPYYNPVYDHRMQTILHIPHSSTFIPLKDGYLLREQDIAEEINKLTDWYTDELFDTFSAIKIVAPFSRIFCDVERFKDDEQEVMAQYGMGALYEKTDDGRQLRNISAELRQKILKDFYEPHHQRFTKAVSNELDSFGKAIIVDCHSFPDVPMKRDLYQETPRPDINIGADDFHTPAELTKISEEYFKSKGYNVLINRPYYGSIVPMQYYRRNGNVMSIMIEINRKLYLRPGSTLKNKNFPDIKGTMTTYLDTISRM